MHFLVRNNNIHSNFSWNILIEELHGRKLPTSDSEEQRESKLQQSYLHIFQMDSEYMTELNTQYLAIVLRIPLSSMY